VAKHPYRPNPEHPALPGIYSPAKGRGNYDGDTIEVELPLFGSCRIRLSGVNTPELGESGGDTARRYVESRLASCGELWVWLALADDTDKDGRISIRELLKTASWDRWPGTVFCDGSDIRAELLENEMAVKT
jgi:endonuclease YncB( thermonuclease family)